MEKYGKSFWELNRKEKAEYILEYYKIHMIGGVIGIVIAYSLLNHYVLNPPKEPIIDISFTAAYLEPQGFETLQKEVREFVEEKIPGKTAQVEHLYFSENNDPQTQMVMTTKLVGKATTGELDILVLNEDHLSYFNENQILLPLSDYLDHEQIKEYAVEVIEIEKDGKKVAVAFKVAKNTKIGRLYPEAMQGYFGVSSETKELEIIKELIPLLF